jgi:hypothetical protein
MKIWFKRWPSGLRASTAPNIDREVARRAASRIIERSMGVTLDGISIKELIRDGRS